MRIKGNWTGHLGLYVMRSPLGPHSPRPHCPPTAKIRFRASIAREDSKLLPADFPKHIERIRRANLESSGRLLEADSIPPK